MSDNITHVVTLIIDDYVVSTLYSYHNMAKTLRMSWFLLKGVPQAEVCIRRGGEFVGWLHTNFRGELEEVDIHGPNQFGRSLVTPINPAWLEIIS